MIWVQHKDAMVRVVVVVVVRSILPGRYLLFLFYLPVALQVLNSEVTRLVMQSSADKWFKW
jgi:hypothetical protein